MIPNPGDYSPNWSFRTTQAKPKLKHILHDAHDETRRLGIAVQHPRHTTLAALKSTTSQGITDVNRQFLETKALERIIWGQPLKSIQDVGCNMPIAESNLANLLNFSIRSATTRRIGSTSSWVLKCSSSSPQMARINRGWRMRPSSSLVDCLACCLGNFNRSLKYENRCEHPPNRLQKKSLLFFIRATISCTIWFMSNLLPHIGWMKPKLVMTRGVRYENAGGFRCRFTGN
jgi:hypothetical protein